MVKKQLAARGISDKLVLEAMGCVPRERFVPDNQLQLAYADRPLPIGLDQTISQPYIVALMAECAKLTNRSRVLDVGTGSGYAAAVCAKIADHVWSIERFPKLAQTAERRLKELDIHNITVIEGDGALGFPDAAPFDAILVGAAAPNVPKLLLDQLSDSGTLVIPVGDLAFQELVVVTKSSTGLHQKNAGGCRFVPLVSPKAFTT